MYQPWPTVQPWSAMQMPHVPYYPYYSQPIPFPSPPVAPPTVPPFMPSMTPIAPVLKPPSLLEQFKTKEGTYDITKMMNTMGQAVQVMNQMSGLVKGLTQTFKL